MGVEVMILRKIDILKPAYIHVFERIDGSFFEIETTKADYEQLGQSRHKDPSRLDGKWRHSYAFYKFDTASGKLEDGQYADEDGRQYIICWRGMIARLKSGELNKVISLAAEDKFDIADPVLIPQCRVIAWL